MKRIITLIALLSLFETGLQAQIIDATNNSPHKKEKTSKNSSIYKPMGHYLRFEAGYPQFASVAYGYQLNSNVMLGTGMGITDMPYVYSYHSTNFNSGEEHEGSEILSTQGFPIYAEAIFSTPKFKKAFFVDLKIGGNVFSILREGFIDNYGNYYSERPYPNYQHYSLLRRFFVAVNVGLAYKNFNFGAGVSSNSSRWFSFFVSYNLPLIVY
jgi:hypothetical protein